MDKQKKKAKQSSNKKEIRDFAQDTYDYIWSKQEFFKQGVTEKFAEEYTSRNFSKEEMKNTHFTEYIGKAVRVSQFFLRDYFAHLLNFTKQEKSSFKREAKLMWSHWLDNRNNVFVKVIDTLAIVAEIYLFCDSYRGETINLEFSEMTEWFIEWFEGNLASEFFRSGGWKNLNEIAQKWYDKLFEDLKARMFFPYTAKDSTDERFAHSCKLIQHLRTSCVKFPVYENSLCHKCIRSTDIDLHRRTVYLRLANEYQDKSLSETDESQNLKIRHKDKTGTLTKHEYSSLKSETSKKLPTKDTSTVVPEQQFDEPRNDLVGKASPKEKSPISKVSSSTSATSLYFPESPTYLEPTLSSEEKDLISGEIRASESDERINYDEFIEKLFESVKNIHCQVEGPKDQIKFYLISEKFSNSFKKLFDSFSSSPEEEKLRKSNISEDLKSGQKTVSVAELGKLEVLTNEYIYYFIGGEEKEPVKSKHRRKSQSNIT